MALIYKRISINLGAGGADVKDIKISIDDTDSGFIEDKLVVGSTKLIKQTLIPGGNELLQLDVDETKINHNNLLNYSIDQHRVLNDLTTTTTSLWSSSKIQTDLNGKINGITTIADNTLIKSVGTSGVDVEATGITVDDFNNIVGVNNLTVGGNLTVNGTTTTINSQTVDVADANITVNSGGTQLSANTQDAGITVQMSDALNAIIGYDSTVSSRFRIGDTTDSREVATVSHTQTLSNKTIDADINTISNLETDNLKAGVLATNLDLAVTNTNIPAAQAVKDYVQARVAEVDQAIEITYSNVSSGLAATNVQTAIDEVEGRVDTAETNLNTHLNTGASKHDANQIDYSNVTSGLVATQVQAAIDEVEGRVDSVETTASTNTTTINNHINDTVGAHAATAISFSPIGNIVATEVQAALQELDTEKYIAANFNPDFDTRLATKTTDNLAEGATNLYYTDARAHIVQGDLNQGSFALAQSQLDAPVTGFNFANAGVRSFKALVSVYIDATVDLYEEFEISGIQRGADWQVSIESTGDNTQIFFDVNSTGQVIYDSQAYAGFVSGVIKFRAQVTTV